MKGQELIKFGQFQNVNTPGKKKSLKSKDMAKFLVQEQLKAAADK